MWGSCLRLQKSTTLHQVQEGRHSCSSAALMPTFLHLMKSNTSFFPNVNNCPTFPTFHCVPIERRYTKNFQQHLFHAFFPYQAGRWSAVWETICTCISKLRRHVKNLQHILKISIFYNALEAISSIIHLLSIRIPKFEINTSTIPKSQKISKIKDVHVVDNLESTTTDIFNVMQYTDTIWNWKTDEYFHSTSYNVHGDRKSISKFQTIHYLSLINDQRTTWKKKRNKQPNMQNNFLNTAFLFKTGAKYKKR